MGINNRHAYTRAYVDENTVTLDTYTLQYLS